MSTKTYKRGDVVEIDGNRYTLTDRRPGVGGWWAEGLPGVVAVKATPKAGASVDFAATHRTRELQRMAAEISRSKVYEFYTVPSGEYLRYMAHKNENCSRIVEMNQQPTTDVTAASAAYMFMQAETAGGNAVNTRVKNVHICPCALNWQS